MWIVPAATTTVSASTVRRPPAAVRASSATARAPRMTKRSRADAGARARAGRARGHEVRVAGVLLGAGRAAEGAHAAPLAAARVALQVAAGPAEPLRAAARDRRRSRRPARRAPPRRRASPRRGAKHGASASGVSAWRPNSARQRASTWSGVRKQVPELTSVVPPMPAAERQDDRRRRRPSAICPPSRYRRVSMSRGRPVSVAGRMALALLEHDDAQPALGELLRDDARRRRPRRSRTRRRAASARRRSVAPSRSSATAGPIAGARRARTSRTRAAASYPSAAMTRASPW